MRLPCQAEAHPSASSPDSPPHSKCANDSAPADTKPPPLEDLLRRLTQEQRNIVETTKDCSETVLQLRQKFSDLKLDSKTSKFSKALHVLESFVGGLSTISQGLGPAADPALIVMGCVKLVFSLSARFVAVVERMVDCLADLFNTLPRLDGYLGLFPIPKLQTLLSDICAECIRFCVTCAEYLGRSTVRNAVSLIWSPLDKTLETTQKNINGLNSEFYSEVQLAYFTVTIQWQQRMGTLPGQQAQPPALAAPHVLRPQNRDFVGRVAILERLEKLFSGKGASSCTIYGMGGMGKSQIALELAHRVKAHFDHAVWVHAESELDLTKSFVEMARRFDLYDTSLPFEENVELTRRFLNSTTKRCLLILDNVDETQFLSRYWPESESVSVLVTTQRSQIGRLTSESIQIDAMGKSEGAELLLQLSGNTNPTSPNEEARRFSESLGGLPLAIAHYAGYMTRSKMSLDEFHTVFRDHFQDSHIWHSPSENLDGYTKTLDSVWSLALSKLSPEARQTLNLLVYFREDATPEMMLLEGDYGEEQGKHLMKLRSLVMELQDRQLVERTSSGADAMLRTHTAFKRTVILRLAETPGDRQKAFDKAVSSIRRSLPQRCLDKGRSGVDLQSVINMCLPHVLSLKREFQLAEPPLNGSLEFADVLCDASFYLWEQHFLADALSCATVGEEICSGILGKDDDSPLHIQFFGLLANLYHTSPNQGQRANALEMYKKVMAGRQAHIARLPPDKVTSTDKIDLARAYNDFAEWLVDEERLDEALELVQKAIDIYRALGDEETLTFRFSNQYGTFSLIYCGLRRMDEALDYGRQSLQLIVKLYGERYYFTTIFQLHYAVVLLIAGKAAEALPVFRAVLNTRIDLRGELDSETLDAMMWLGVVHYYLGDLDESEPLLEKAVSLKDKACWTYTGAARALLWWAVVLVQRGKTKEAEAAVEKAQKEAPDVLGGEKRSIIDHLEVCERAINCWQYGRCTGVFQVEQTIKPKA